VQDSNIKYTSNCNRPNCTLHPTNTTAHLHLHNKKFQSIQSYILSNQKLQKLDSPCWFSQRHSSPTQVRCARCIRHNVSSDPIALFTFCVMRHDSAERHILGVVHPGGYNPKIWTLGWDFCTMHLPHKFHHPMVTCSEVIVLTNQQTHTNKQTPLKTSNTIRYATTLGKEMTTNVI